MMNRAMRGIPSQGESDVSVPRFDPGRGDFIRGIEPMPGPGGVVPPPPPPDGRRPEIARVSLGSPAPTMLAQAASEPTLRVNPFNTGAWPSPEEQASRLEQVRRQMERMRRENPRLYERLPLLHDLVTPSAPAVPTPEILHQRLWTPPVPASLVQRV